MPLGSSLVSPPHHGALSAADTIGDKPKGGPDGAWRQLQARASGKEEGAAVASGRHALGMPERGRDGPHFSAWAASRTDPSVRGGATVFGSCLGSWRQCAPRARGADADLGESACATARRARSLMGSAPPTASSASADGQPKALREGPAHSYLTAPRRAPKPPPVRTPARAP